MSEEASGQQARRTKIYKRGPLGDFVAAAQLLGLEEGQLAEKLGYTKSAPSGWHKDGTVPAVLKWALKGVLAEGSKPPAYYMLVEVADGHARVVRTVSVDKVDRVQIAGVSYILLEEGKGGLINV